MIVLLGKYCDLYYLWKSTKSAHQDEAFQRQCGSQPKTDGSVFFPDENWLTLTAFKKPCEIY